MFGGDNTGPPFISGGAKVGPSGAHAPAVKLCPGSQATVTLKNGRYTIDVLYKKLSCRTMLHVIEYFAKSLGSLEVTPLSRARRVSRWYSIITMSLSRTVSENLGVTENGTIPSIAYEFLFVFHCNYDHVFYHFRNWYKSN